MRTLAINHSKWDRLGVLSASACAIHCLLLPVVVVLLPVVTAKSLLAGVVEWVLIGGSLLAGGVSLGHGSFLGHRQPVPGLLFLAGVSILLFLRGMAERHGLEPVAVLAAAACLISAHHLNQKHCRQCRACSPPPPT